MARSASAPTMRLGDHGLAWPKSGNNGRRIRSARMTAGNRLQPRLVLLCGLPASGKTTLARELADAYGAVRLNPDEWKRALDADPFDEHFRVGLEGQLWRLTQRLLTLGTSVILEWGFWSRAE